jgi:hypothetical protein
MGTITLAGTIGTTGGAIRAAACIVGPDLPSLPPRGRACP